MKKSILSLSVFLMALAASAQCDPSAHDWGKASFGVSPDPQFGEQFDAATINVPYEEVIFVKAPTSAADIDETLPDIVAIDSLRLDDVLLDNGTGFVSLNSVGLYLTCNNNGDSPNPCVFLPGNAYCGDIAGTPTVAGEFPVKIAVTGFLDFFGPQAIPYEFEGYTLIVNGGNISVSETVAVQALTVGQNSPNPAVDVTNIQYELTVPSEVEVVVINLVGTQVYSKKAMGKKGVNNFRLDTSDLESGVYLYSVTAGEKKFTRRMLVQH
jgi:hypothetical protein